jgi:limonene-1,2-epoxide hydrolase
MTNSADAVRALWTALSGRDWAAVAGRLSDDCIYVDMPLGPALAARGPADILKRLRVGLEGLASYENHDGLLLADGEHVMYEHSETWVFATGERFVLPFATVHRVVDGKVTLWKDYWDFGAVANNAPPGWLEGLMSADMSWIFDATGLV